MITNEEFNEAVKAICEDPSNEEAMQVFINYGIQEGFIQYEVYRIG